MDILSKILFIILIISPFIYIASKLMLYETYETEIILSVQSSNISNMAWN